MSNMTDLWLSGVFFQALNTPKLAGELTTLPQTRRLGRGTPPLHTLTLATATASRSRRLTSEAPPTQIPGYTYDRVGARIAPTHRPIYGIE